jgi:23S rRNA (pseudouridine1915-N3)-methyltransferase
MRVVIAAIGVPRDPAVGAAITEYETRAARYWPLDVRAVREESARHLTPEMVREREGERLAAAVGGAPALVVACAEDGARMTSVEFARWLQSEREAARRDVAFVIGGAYGLGRAVLEAAGRRLSLAPWTLPHEMARLVLAEQLYRAGTIVRGEPYHK